MPANILKREISESVYLLREVDSAIYKAVLAHKTTATNNKIKPEFDCASQSINT